jgi:DNA-directed RNA polymerase subunit F
MKSKRTVKTELAKRITVVEALAAAYNFKAHEQMLLHLTSASLAYLRNLARIKKKSVEELNEVDIAAQLEKDAVNRLAGMDELYEHTEQTEEPV